MDKSNLFKKIFKSILVGIFMSFSEMSNHKTRSFLSILGVLLGVASLVMMLTLVGGIDQFLNKKMGKWVGSVWFWSKWNPSDNESIIWSRSPGLKLSDGQYLLNNSKYVKDVPQSISRSVPVLLNKESMFCQILGFDSASLESSKDDIKLIAGRWIEKTDFLSGTPNCVISWQIAEKMMKNYHLDNLHKTLSTAVNLGKYNYTIVGIYGPANTHQPNRHLRQEIIISLKSMQKYGTGFDPDPGSIQAQVTDAKQVKAMSKLIAIKLRERHRGVDDFEFRTAEWLDKVIEMLTNVSLLMTIISCISLTIGGLSIMNVMLSSVSERIREIGIRKALGADNLQIFVQFITETITLSLTGGCFGFLFGLTPLLFKEAILRSTQGSIEPTILPMHILFTFTLITMLGIIFGLYPAIKASNMDPVDALRYE